MSNRMKLFGTTCIFKSQSNMSIFHSQAGASSNPRRECENRYIVWRVSLVIKKKKSNIQFEKGVPYEL